MGISIWKDELVDQIEWHWGNQLRARLDGLTDDEYFWQPAVESWNVRPSGTPGAAIQAGSGDFVIDFAVPEPTPPPLTTIAWRLGHIIVGVLAARTHGHFNGPEADYMSWDYAGSAGEALDQLDTQYAAWLTGVRSLDDAALLEPCGPTEGPYADRSMATLVLHINRELIHHGGEIALLRDLYAHREE